MRRSIRQIYAIAQQTAAESLRQQLFVVLLLLVAGLLILNPSLSKFTLDDDNKLLIDLGMSTILLGGLVLATFSAAATIRREIEQGTLLTVATKPIGRGVHLLGKYCGIAASSTLAVWIWIVIHLLCLRHGVLQTARDPLDGPVLTFAGAATLLAFAWAVGGNYFLSRHFGASLAKALAPLLTLAYVAVLLVGKGWKFQDFTTDFELQTLFALALLLQTTWLFCALALCAATRLGQVSTLLVCLLVFLAGLSSDYFFGRLAVSSGWASFVYSVVPNMQFLWLADALTQEHTVSGRYLGLASIYATCFTLAAIAFAACLSKREVAR